MIFEFIYNHTTVVATGAVLAAVPGGPGLEGADTDPRLTCSVCLKL